jgi:hypothetical protein
MKRFFGKHAVLAVPRLFLYDSGQSAKGLGYEKCAHSLIMLVHGKLFNEMVFELEYVHSHAEKSVGGFFLSPEPEVT